MTYWDVKCKICGRTKIMGLNSLRVSTSCGCRQTGKGNLNKSWKGVGEFSSTHFSEIKKQAHRRHIEFNVDIDYLWNLYVNQNRKCALSGLDISFGETVYKKNQDKYRMNRTSNTVSLDRINSNRGYIEGNVQWVHKDLNFMKQQFDQSYFVDLCRLVVENNKEKIKCDI